jgi:single-strand DNA-binding protein
MNSVHFVGRLTKDPQLKMSSAEKVPYCRFSIAIDRGKDKQGNSLGTDYPGIVVFGKAAENLCKFCGKGQLLSVEGRYRTNRYEKDGKIYYSEDIYANRLQFLSRSKQAEKNDAPAEADIQEASDAQFTAMPDNTRMGEPVDF